MVFRSASDQTQKVTDEHVMMCICFVIGQQQQVDDVCLLSMWCDIEWDGLGFVKSPR